MRHRAPRYLLFLKFLKLLKLPRGSRHLLAGHRRAGWLITNQKTRLTLAMASVMVLACAAFVAATELPDDDSVAAPEVPTYARQPMRSGTADQVSRSSERAPLDLPYGSPTQDPPDRQAPAPAPEDPQPGSDGTGVPSEDSDGEPATPAPEPAPVAPPELPSQTPTTDDPGAGLDVSSPPSLEVPMGAPTGPSDGTEEWPTEEPADESSEDREDVGHDEEYDGEEPTEEESSTPTPATADQTAPETEIVSSPTVSESALAASSFEFTANESATFMCSVDGQAYAACGSPTEYGDLGPGWHTFAVQATDAAGNADPSPAQTSWLATGADSGGPGPLVGEVTPTEDSLLP